MTRPGAREVIAQVTDAGSWKSWDQAPAEVSPGPRYAGEIARARAETGLDESVLTGLATIGGHRIALLVGEFGFLGGSIGYAAAERLAAAIRRATAERLPLLALPTSGGTRMQEGTPAFVQMVKITHAIVGHKAAHLPYLVYLRHPTTGGVFASWGSLGHLTFAEPGALIGFLGPRVYRALHDAPFPTGVQTAENLHACGLVDAIVALPRLRNVIANALTITLAQRITATEPHLHYVSPAPVPAWESVCASRQSDRPGVRELLQHAASSVLLLRGGGRGRHDPGLVLALAQFGGRSCVVLGHDRHNPSPHAALGPGALQQARRGMRLAADLALPLVSVIDTAGAALSREAEEHGLAGEIAHCIAEMITVDVPTISVILGQGAGGAALALLPADRVVAARHGWLSPLPPEGASAIVHHDTAHAAMMADEQRVRSGDLLAAGIVDAVIPEYPDAASEPTAFCRRVGSALRHELGSVTAVDTATRLARRGLRFTRLGCDDPTFAQAG